MPDAAHHDPGGSSRDLTPAVSTGAATDCRALVPPAPVTDAVNDVQDLVPEVVEDLPEPVPDDIENLAPEVVENPDRPGRPRTRGPTLNHLRDPRRPEPDHRRRHIHGRLPTSPSPHRRHVSSPTADDPSPCEVNPGPDQSTQVWVRIQDEVPGVFTGGRACRARRPGRRAGEIVEKHLKGVERISDGSPGGRVIADHQARGEHGILGFKWSLVTPL